MSHTFNAELTLDCEIEYTCISKGYPATGPTYDCAGQPAEPAEFQIRVMCNGRDITDILSDDQLEDLQDQAAEDYETEEPDYSDEDDY
jgi:hypothetical protein